jgi:hypothetical protein
VGAVATALVGAVVTLGWSTTMNWWSARDPVNTTVLEDGAEKGGGGSGRYDEDGFKILVEDESALPSDIADTDTCSGLWDAGRGSGGRLVAEPDRDMNVHLEGASKNGTTIVALRAVVTRHVPAPDGVLLLCPPALLVGSAQEPIHVNFDMSVVDLDETNTVSARRTGGGPDLAQFEDGFTITLKENESVQLDIETTYPSDAIEWHIEADALVDGETRTIVIDDDGEEFVSPGGRGYDEYLRGHSGEEEGWDNGPPADWGIDPSAVRETSSDGSPVLRSRDVIVPFTEGLDIYVPYARPGGRWIRHDEDKLIAFNLRGVEPARPTLEAGDSCGWEQGSDDGRVREVLPARSEDHTHGRQEFEHRSEEFICSFPAPEHGRDSLDGRVEQFWTCGGAPCPEVKYAVQSVQRKNSDVVLWYRSDELSSADRALAAQVLDGVQEAGG